jgi:hypothetical protein
VSIGIYNDPGLDHITHASASEWKFYLPDQTEVLDRWMELPNKQPDG